MRQVRYYYILLSSNANLRKQSQQFNIRAHRKLEIFSIMVDTE